MHRLSNELEIKVADFGLSVNMYQKIYFKQKTGQNKTPLHVPIKWMAPESIKFDDDRIYSEKSDVVSMIVILHYWHMVNGHAWFSQYYL